MLTYYQWDSLRFIWGQFHKKIHHKNELENYIPNFFLQISQGPMSCDIVMPYGEWRHWSGSTLAQVMACCLNQCWFSFKIFFCGIFLRANSAILKEVHISLTLTLLSYLPWVNMLKHWGQHKIAAISQTTFSNAFAWMTMYEFQLKFHWSLFLRVQLTISQHWFR